MIFIKHLIQLIITVSTSYFATKNLKKYIKSSFDISVHQEIISQAFEVLNDVVNDKYKMKYGTHYVANYDINQIKIQPQSDYCIRSDTYKYYHPGMVLEDLYVVREKSVEIPKQIVKERTFDLLPFLNRYRKPVSKQNKYVWPLQATQLFMHYDHLNNEYKYGKEILCLFQKYNHVPGKFSISHKNNLMDNFHRQLDSLRSKNKSSECIRNASYIPTTYRLYKKSECIQFFRYLNSTEYQDKLVQQGPQFITKAGEEVHRGRGITVLFETESKQIQQLYKYGQMCGNDTQILIAQKYISNPYLYKGHKIEFRIYFTITSTDPMIVHAYKKALIKRCAKPFNIYSTEKAAHVCNTAIVKSTLKNEEVEEVEDDIQKEDDEDETPNQKQLEEMIEEEEFFIDWYLEGLQELLIQQKKIKDTNWLENYLYPRVYRSIIHLVRSGEYNFYRDSRVGEFFAIDFILSDDLEIYVLECNYNPQILSVTPERIRRNYKMVTDTLEVFHAYTKSRYIRIRKFIKKLLLAASKISSQQGKNKRQILYTGTAREYMKLAMNEAPLKNEFLKAFKEKLEDHIKISKDNLYEKIIDENEKGPAAYHNLIAQECL